MKTIIQNIKNVSFSDISGRKTSMVDIRLMVIDDLAYGTFANCALVHPETGMIGCCELVADKELEKLSAALRNNESVKGITLRGWETVYFHSLEQVARSMDVHAHELHDSTSIRTMEPEEVQAC